MEWVHDAKDETGGWLDADREPLDFPLLQTEWRIGKEVDRFRFAIGCGEDDGTRVDCDVVESCDPRLPAQQASGGNDLAWTSEEV
jgi:hypothetical protein